MAEIKLPEGIESLPITSWVNAHESFTHQFKPGASFKLRLPASTTDMTAQYKATTANFQWLIQYGIDHNIQLRAMGSGWSFSEVAVCEGGVVDTKSLRLSFTIGKSFVNPAYLQNGRQASDLFFTQCGMSMLMLSEKLEIEQNPKRCLKASGASNGQSVAGATATGTHGAAFNTGAVHDSIVGLHIVVGPKRHVWLERKSYPVASDQFINWLGAEPIRDDDMFNSAVVSFGSFGFIHGVLLETDPIFLLEEHRFDHIPYNDALKNGLNTLDFTALRKIAAIPNDAPDKTLYHFEAILNPHQFEPNNPDKGIYLKSLHKVPYPANYQRQVRKDGGTTYGDDTLATVQTILDMLGKNIAVKLVPALVNKLYPLSYKAAQLTPMTIGETFANTRFRGEAASAAIAVDIKDATRVVDEVVAINKTTTFPGALALRFVKGTKATLGFTKFDKTCVLELDGVNSEVTRDFYWKIWTRLEELNIPFTVHWGKTNYLLNEQRVRKMYGDKAVETWLSCRNKLLDPATRNVFRNIFIDNCGLSKAPAAGAPPPVKPPIA